MTVQIELPDIFPTLNEISQTLKEISCALQKLTYSNQSEWLNATDFCKKYNISRPTLYKKVKEGSIEACDFGGDINRYRMKGVL